MTSVAGAGGQKLAFLIVAAVLGTVIAVVVFTRRALQLGIALFAGFALSSILIECVQSFLLALATPSQKLLDPTLIGFIVIFSFCTSAALVIIYGPRAPRLGRADVAAFSLVGAIILVLISNKLFSSLTSSSVLASTGWLLRGEDNDKWIDLASNITSNHLVSVAGANSGFEAVAVFLGVQFANVVSQLVLGGDNQLATASFGVVLAHGIPLVLAPLATTPFLLGRQPQEDVSFFRKVKFSGYLVTNVVFVAGLLIDVSFGHLTVECSAVVLVFALGLALNARGKLNRYIFALVLISTSGAIWLPLNYFSLVVAFVGITLPFVLRKTLTPRIFGLTILAVCVNAIVTLFIQFPDFMYLSGQSSESGIPVQRLVISEGGVPDSDWALILFAVVGVVSVLLSASKLAARARALSLAPLILFVAYSLAIVYYDSWATGAGAHYGTRKIIFLVCIVLVALCLPMAMEHVAEKFRSAHHVRVVLAIAVLLVFSMNGFIPRAVGVASPTMWPHAEPTAWRSQVEVKNTGSQPLAELPIACVTFSGQEYSATDDAYFCTRLLVSLRGLEQKAGALVELMLIKNFAIGSPSVGRLMTLDTKILDSMVLVIDGHGNVVDELSVRHLYDRLTTAVLDPVTVDGSPA